MISIIFCNGVSQYDIMARFNWRVCALHRLDSVSFFFSEESLQVDKSHTTGSIAQFAVLGFIFYALDSKFQAWLFQATPSQPISLSRSMLRKVCRWTHRTGAIVHHWMLLDVTGFSGWRFAALIPSPWIYIHGPASRFQVSFCDLADLDRQLGICWMTSI